MRRVGGFLAALVAAWGLADGAAAKPRVVSLDMCTDQLLLSLAEPEQIVSVTATAVTERLSPFAARARALAVPVNRRNVEEVMRFSPDVVLVGQRGGKAAETLRAMGLRVERFPTPKSVDEAIAQVRRAGRILQQPEAAERAAAVIAAARLRARAAAPAEGPGAVMFLPGGYGFGANTMLSDMLRDAGIRNVLAEAGRTGMARVDLETMVVMHPDVLLVNDTIFSGAPRQATVLLQHPALRRATPGTRQMEFPVRLWLCGGVQTAQGYDYLVDRVLAGLATEGMR